MTGKIHPEYSGLRLDCTRGCRIGANTQPVKLTEQRLELPLGGYNTTAQQ